MVDAQLEIICLAGGDLTPDAGRESRAECSHQPVKYPDNGTTSGSNLLDDSAVQCKEKGNLSAAELKCCQAQD